MKKLLWLVTALAVTFFCFNASAQTGWKWGLTSQNTGDNDGEVWGSTVADHSGNVYFSIMQDFADSITLGTHTVYNPTHSRQLVVAKVDSGGHYTWATGIVATPTSLVVDQQGMLYVLGSYADTCVIGSVTLTNTAPGRMMFIAKYTPSGTLVWARNLFVAMTYTTSIGIDHANNIYIAGCYQQASLTVGSTTLTNTNPSGLSSDCFYMRLDTACNVIWIKSFGGNKNELAMGNAAGGGHCIAVTPNGDFYLSGISTSDSMTIGSTTITAGAKNPVNGTRITYLAMFDKNGHNIWAKALDPMVGINVMAADIWGNCYITGTIDSAATLGTFILPWVDDRDLMIARFDKLGNCIWAKSAGGAGTEEGWGITADRCGNVWVAGGFPTWTPLTLSGVTHTASTWSHDPFFMVQYDSSGNYRSSLHLPTGGDDIAPIAVDNRGNLYVTGDYNLDPMNATLPLGRDTLFDHGTGREWCFVAKYRYDSLVCPDIKLPLNIARPAINEELSLYPNPVTNILHISSPAVIRSILITDLSGKKILAGDYNTKEAEIDMTRLAPGVYLAKINELMVRKFVKE